MKVPEKRQPKSNVDKYTTESKVSMALKSQNNREEVETKDLFKTDRPGGNYWIIETVPEAFKESKRRKHGFIGWQRL